MRTLRIITLALSVIVLASCDKEPQAKIHAVTLNATDITGTTAVLSGTIKNMDNSVLSDGIKVGFLINTIENPTFLRGVKYYCELEGSSFKVEVSGLKYNTRYYFRAFVSIKDEDYLADVESFTTKRAQVTTGDVKNIGFYYADFPICFTIDKSVLSGGGISTVFVVFSHEPNVIEHYESKAEWDWVLLHKDIKEVNEYTMRVMLTPNTHYYYAAGIRISGEPIFGEVKEFTSDNNYVAKSVDLGLSVKWSSMNLGATKPEEAGYYYSWAETESKYLNMFHQNYYKWWDINTKSFTKYYKYGGITRIQPDDDAAAVHLGGSWRIPTSEEYRELIDNCDVKSYTLNGTNGYLCSSKKEGNTNSIFIPLAGYYQFGAYYPDNCSFWSSDLGDGPDDGYCCFNMRMASARLYNGLPIRPVLAE